MPIYSMTGYASAQAELHPDTPDNAAPSGPALRLGLEIRSVNSRFLDLSFKMPEELRQHEAALRALVTQHLKRGKVDAFFVVGAPQAPVVDALLHTEGISLLNFAQAEGYVRHFPHLVKIVLPRGAIDIQVPIWQSSRASISPGSAFTRARPCVSIASPFIACASDQGCASRAQMPSTQ